MHWGCVKKKIVNMYLFGQYYQEDTGNNYQNFADGSFILYGLWCEGFKNETGGMASWCFSNGHNTSLAIVMPEI